MKVVILGASGMLGHDITEAFRDVDLHPFSKDELNITNKELLKRRMNEINPDLVINAAGYTDVDGSETNFDIAVKVNSDGVKNIAEASNEYDFDILHISTDYIFSGDNKEGYKEDSVPNPINSYGKSKYMGEKHLKDIATRYYLIRTSWLYGKHGKNFVKVILNLAKIKKEIEVVNDQIGCPTYTKDFAKAIRCIIDTKPSYGTYHLTNSGKCSWYHFAKKIVDIKKLGVAVKPTNSQNFIRLARRPKNSILLNTKLPPLRKWEEALEEYLKENE